MALYEYTFHLARPAQPASISAQLATAGLVELVGEDEALIQGAHAFASEFTVDLPGGDDVQVASFLLDDGVFEAHLSPSLDMFAEWIHQVADAARLATLFVPGGPDASAYSRGDRLAALRSYLGALWASGEITVAHPLMYFGTSIPAIAACVDEQEPDFYHRLHFDSHGCLLLFADRHDDGSFELLESGPLQREMLRVFGERR